MSSYAYAPNSLKTALALDARAKQEEAEIFDCLLRHLQKMHPEADLSWALVPMEDYGGEFLEISTQGWDCTPYYSLKPWLSDVPTCAWEAVDYINGGLRMLSGRSLVALAVLLIDQLSGVVGSGMLH